MSRRHPRLGDVALFGGSVVPSQYPDVVLAQGPTHFWLLDETSGTTAEDIAGASDGTYLNGFSLGNTGPLIGHTAFGIGSDGVVNCGVINMADVGSSYTYWVKQVPGGATRYMIAKGGSDQPEVSIFTPDFLVVGIGGPPIANGPDLDANWHHIAYVHEGPLAADQKLYVDGVDVTLAPAAAAFLPTAANLLIGSRLVDGTNALTNGFMAAVAVWTGTALTPAQIAAQFAAR